jgi:hypothetical protein
MCDPDCVDSGFRSRGQGTFHLDLLLCDIGCWSENHQEVMQTGCRREYDNWAKVAVIMGELGSIGEDS